MKLKLLIGVIASVFVSGAAFAQAASAPAPDAAHERADRMQKHFEQLDKNKDGAIDRQESAGHKFLSKEFDAIDTSKDGKLTKAELEAKRGAMHDKRKAKFEERFKAADINGDGAIGKDEAAKMPGLEKHFDRIDANKDGKLTREEMMTGHARGHGKRHGRGDHAARFEERFKAADKDGDGALSKAEAEAGKMQHLAKGFDSIDANKDARITKEELHAAMKRHHETRKKGKDSLEGPKK